MIHIYLPWKRFEARAAPVFPRRSLAHTPKPTVNGPRHSSKRGTIPLIGFMGVEIKTAREKRWLTHGMSIYLRLLRLASCLCPNQKDTGRSAGWFPPGSPWSWDDAIDWEDLCAFVFYRSDAASTHDGAFSCRYGRK